ncbi:hypothetical protein FALCPG4_014905 [Fusarium falciforme]
MDITVLDIGNEGLETRKVHSNVIVDLLEEPLPPDHRCCRWINIKQPSPDAISILREHTGLESLGAYKEASKTLLRWDSSSNGYVGVPFPILHLDPSTNVPNEPRALSSLQREMIQEYVYVFSNSDNKVVTLSGIADCDLDASVKAMLSRNCSSPQMLHASSMLSAVICSVVDRSVAMAITCLERVKTLELHVLTQSEEQQIQDVYLILAAIRRVQRSLRTSVRLVEALHTQESVKGTVRECVGRVGVSQDPQPTISQDPCLKVVRLRCSTAISSLDASIEVLERCIGILSRSVSLRGQRTRTQTLWIMVWLLLVTALAATMLKLILVK